MILQDKDYLCHLSLPNYPSCTGCTIDVSWDLQIIFKKMSSKVCDFQQCSSIKEIVKEITSIIVNLNISSMFFKSIISI